MAMDPETATGSPPPGAGAAARPAGLSSANTMTTPLLLNPAYARSKSLVSDELRHFRISLRWCALDHSSCAGRVVSYAAFALLAVAVPAATTLAVRSPGSGAADVSSVNKLVQLPVSALAAISFFTLSGFFRRYGLRQLLFLDGGLREDTAYVQRGYTQELDRAFRQLTCILLPSFCMELAHKVVFFWRVPVGVPGGRLPWGSSIALVATVASWVYRTMVFLLVCVLFRLTCYLQILRLEGFRKLLEGCGASEAGDIFREHVRIRRQLLVTSHRYRMFIIGSFVIISISQLGALMIVLSSKSDRNFCNSGDLLVCSVVQLSGFLMCLMAAARITHRAQRVVAIASWWHMVMTCSSSEHPPVAAPAKNQAPPPPPLLESTPQDDDAPDTPLDNNEKPSAEESWAVVPLAPPEGYAAVETRKALVKYLQHNSGGITLFGYALDRGLLHTLFAFEMSLVLWILSKVVVLS